MRESGGTATLRDGRWGSSTDAAGRHRPADEQDALRVLLLDPQALVRQTLRTALEARPGIRIIAEARDTHEAVNAAAALGPDLALIHACLEMPDVLRSVEVIRESAPDCRVILIGADEDIGMLIAALDAGASGYFTKSSPFSDLVEAADHTSRGKVLLPRAMLEELLAKLLEQRTEEMHALHKVSRLTGREREVLLLLADGGDNERIGDALVISPQTARTHVQNILTKLGLHSRLEAVAFVRRLGRHAELLRRPA
jgi:DNA-binding NarL/FixJ family response regulator